MSDTSPAERADMLANAIAAKLLGAVNAPEQEIYRVSREIVALATLPAPNDDLRAENGRLREALRAIMDLPGEINPANYDHNDVHVLNNSHIEAFHIAAAALKENRRG